MTIYEQGLDITCINIGLAVLLYAYRYNEYIVEQMFICPSVIPSIHIYRIICLQFAICHN